jgi:DNA-binding protein H-NS
VQGYTEEVGQLRNTSQALRDELDEKQFDNAEKLQESERDRRDEVQHLQNTIAKLRDELEAEKASKPSKSSRAPKKPKAATGRTRKKGI